MLDEGETHGTLMGQSWETPGSASARPRNISQAYGQQPKGSFPMLGTPWKVAERRSAPSGGQDCQPCRDLRILGRLPFPTTGESAQPRTHLKTYNGRTTEM